MAHRNPLPPLAVLLAWLCSGSLPAAEPIPGEQFDKLRALIKPAAEETKWEQIPWLTSLWEARQQAAKQGKPILLWEMDGHPLGCT
jgi:hypothetical protein